MKQETFLYLSSTAWTWLSAIFTFLAVAVALFLPFYLDYLKEKNINNLIEKEYQSNISIIKKALEENNKDYSKSYVWNSEQTYKIVIQAWILSKVNLNNWNDYKLHLAVSDSNKYMYYQEKNWKISELIDYTNKAQNVFKSWFDEKQMNDINIDIFKTKLNEFKF